MAQVYCSGPAGIYSQIDAGTSVLINGSTGFTLKIADLEFAFRLGLRLKRRGPTSKTLQLSAKFSRWSL